MKVRIDDNQPNMPFDKFFKNFLAQNIQEADKSLRKFTKQKENADMFLEYATVEGNEQNVFALSVRRVLRELDAEIQRAKIFKYKMNLVETEFKKYSFEDMGEEEVVQQFVRIQTGGFGSTSTYTSGTGY
jgi:hypothetical protein